MTEKEKMQSGQLFNPQDSLLKKERMNARKLLHQLNTLPPEQKKVFQRLKSSLCPNASERFFIQAPFFCDYGYPIFAQEDVFINFNCTFLDAAPIHIGTRTLIGPQVQIYTVLHPIDAETRRTGLESAQAVFIGADVWIGGAAIICPGVHIGDRAVIGAGSVVTRDIPSDVFAAGNPCKPIRKI